MNSRSAGKVLTVIAVAIIALATLTPSSQAATRESFCLICGELGGVDFVLNLLLFAPLGAGLAMVSVRWPKAFVIIVTSTISIELLQLTVIPGRDASFGDIVANTTGGVLGFTVGRRVASIILPTPDGARRLMMVWLLGWVAGEATASYALQPSPTHGPYFGQLSRALDDLPRYPGRVLLARVGAEIIPDWNVAHAERAAASLRRGDRVEALVESSRAPSSPTSIVRVADASENEILLIARDAARARFGIRTHASDLRLRPPYFALAGAFPSIQPGAADTVRIIGAYSPPIVEVHASRSGREATMRVRLTPWSTWRMFALSSTDYTGRSEDAALDVVFLVLTLIPAGYWLAMAARHASARDAARLLVPMLAVLAVGFAVSIGMVGMAAPNAIEVFAMVFALVIGAGASAFVQRQWAQGHPSTRA